MSDELSFGRDRKPRRHRRWLLAGAAAALAAALAATFLWYLPGMHQHAARTRPVAGPSPTVRAATGSAAGVGPAALASTPARMTGLPLPGDASLRLLSGGHAPAWLSVPGGRAEPIRGLPPSGADYQFTRLAGGWAAQPFPGGNVGCDDCAPPALPVYYVADGSSVARRIGTAAFTAPAAAPGALWLVSYRAGANLSTAAGSAREVGVTGTARGPRLALPAGYLIDTGTRAGLLLIRAVADPDSVRYQLWNAGTRRVTGSFVNLIAAGPGEIAWMPGCTTACRVHVLELPGGGRQEIPLPAGSKAWAGAFSPDGRLLALQVTIGETAGGRVAATRLLVAAVARGQLTAVPGSTVGSGNGVAFGWQPGSRRLIADMSVGAAGQPEWQIAVWQPGSARLSVALVRVPPQAWPVIDEGPY